MQNPDRVGTIYYNRGVIAAVNVDRGTARMRRRSTTRSARRSPVRSSATATRRSIITDDAKRKELGIDGMSAVQAVAARTTRVPSAFHMMQWDGKKFQIVTKDWVPARTIRNLSAQLIEESAAVRRGKQHHAAHLLRGVIRLSRAGSGHRCLPARSLRSLSKWSMP